eukprot:c3236_g1_i1.p1 GENE.c3236_g1_i1~~c3236_g1_i1.p1  ORF type:complete len:102 (+),score=24.20 c3236_g1_i1:30-335(+)
MFRIVTSGLYSGVGRYRVVANPNLFKIRLNRFNEKPPSEPAPSECCGNGCDECVWVEYWKKMEEYEKKIKLVELNNQVFQQEETILNNANNANNTNNANSK